VNAVKPKKNTTSMVINRDVLLDVHELKIAMSRREKRIVTLDEAVRYAVQAGFEKHGKEAL
jgi:hypothetical protein